MTERELAICVMVDNLKATEGLNPDETPLTVLDMLNFINNLWALMQGNTGDPYTDNPLPTIINTITHRFYNPDEKLELTHKP